ncbi:MAG: orotidine 5'-phosphate decarboxylase / HUMPS family protein, partial [Candidatus Diapherotrites archaeon]|nr:orotidine 5'-phosphate decarboxylase / HUMPS family protein [Candidatus Diapherotrites archaeon]
MALVLDVHQRYLQIAFNYDLEMVNRIVPSLPQSPRIWVEAGTPFIKRYGVEGIRRIRSIWSGPLVADIKVVDGAVNEVGLAASAGADAVTVIGGASTKTLDLFIEACGRFGLVSMVDLINVENPMRVLRPLKKPPSVVVIHRGRDEETVYGAIIEYKHISKIKSKYDVVVSAAGGVDLKEARSAIFNGANVVVANIVRPEDPWIGIPADADIARIA